MRSNLAVALKAVALCLACVSGATATAPAENVVDGALSTTADLATSKDGVPLPFKRRLGKMARSEGGRKKKIGIYSIFMGEYDVFLKGFLENVREHFVPTHPKVFYIVSDKPQVCADLAMSEPDVECVIKERIGWPYETLYRWNYFKTSFNPSPDKVSHIFFMNANARCQETLGEEVLAPYTAVIHNMHVDAMPYASTSFEKNPVSTAYVPPMAHYKYYGARFMGATTENFVEMCDVLDQNTQIDESNHFIAAWHDESHYNHYMNVVLDGQVKQLGSEYHVPEGEEAGAAPKVVYLNKKDHIPGFSSKSNVWQETVGGEVKPGHPYMTLPVFRGSVYRKLNPDLADMDDEELRQHYINNFDTPYFYETEVFASLFDAKTYMEKHELKTEMEAKLHYIRQGVWSEENAFTVRGADPKSDEFVSYFWQKGDRLQRDLDWRRKLGEPTVVTPLPTNIPTPPTSCVTTCNTVVVTTYISVINNYCNDQYAITNAIWGFCALQAWQALVQATIFCSQKAGAC